MRIFVVFPRAAFSKFHSLPVAVFESQTAALRADNQIAVDLRICRAFLFVGKNFYSAEVQV